MQEKIKEIIAGFLKLPAAQIGASTLVDRSAVSSSILLHRMYAKLAAEGIVIKDYQDVKTFGDLVRRSDGTGEIRATAVSAEASFDNKLTSAVAGLPESINGIGVDIEEIAAMPVTSDFREDAFYTMNFTSSEIAYCILQRDPYASFAGLFAVKEAIVKADNTYKKAAFNTIHIRHLPGGQPFHPSFHLSISHTNTTAVAIALPVTENSKGTTMVNSGLPAPGKTAPSKGILILALLSFILSLITFFLLTRK